MDSQIQNYFPYTKSTENAFTLGTVNQTVAIGFANANNLQLIDTNKRWRVMFYSNTNRGSGQTESHTNWYNASLCSDVFAD